MYRFRFRLGCWRQVLGFRFRLTELQVQGPISTTRLQGIIMQDCAAEQGGSEVDINCTAVIWLLCPAALARPSSQLGLAVSLLTFCDRAVISCVSMFWPAQALILWLMSYDSPRLVLLLLTSNDEKTVTPNPKFSQLHLHEKPTLTVLQ